MSEPKDELLVSLPLRVPVSLKEDLERAAAAWKVKVSAIARRAIQDGMISWQKPEMDAELKAQLVRIERLALSSAGILNLETEQKMDAAWMERFKAKKASLLAAASKP